MEATIVVLTVVWCWLEVRPAWSKPTGVRAASQQATRRLELDYIANAQNSNKNSSTLCTYWTMSFVRARNVNALPSALLRVQVPWQQAEFAYQLPERKLNLNYLVSLLNYLKMRLWPKLTFGHIVNRGRCGLLLRKWRRNEGRRLNTHKKKAWFDHLLVYRLDCPGKVVALECAKRPNAQEMNGPFPLNFGKG
jgi:hypothetical protein